MYPAQFEYHTPGTVKEALDLLGRHKDDAKLLAGGHSLLPAMKLRLAQPKHLVDLRKVSGLSGIKEEGGALVIGAMTTHYQVESSPVVKSKCPMLAAVAGQIGDPMVRNMGTIGGSLAHADPAADYPAAIIALGAEMVAEGPKGKLTQPIPAGLLAAVDGGKVTIARQGDDRRIGARQGRRVEEEHGHLIEHTQLSMGADSEGAWRSGYYADT